MPEIIRQTAPVIDITDEIARIGKIFVRKYNEHGKPVNHNFLLEVRYHKKHKLWMYLKYVGPAFIPFEDKEKSNWCVIHKDITEHIGWDIPQFEDMERELRKKLNP